MPNASGNDEEIRMTFTALQVTEPSQGRFQMDLVQRTLDELPAGEVLIRVRYSSLNFKDALSASGNRGVTRSYPHTPGIDAAGVVEQSSVAEFSAGDEVIVTGYDLGMNTAGGFGQYIRVPAVWVIKRPRELSLRESMILGTAGLTAALCVDKLEQAGLAPDAGPVLVTGATGGVGSIAVALLARLGYAVTAVTGKADRAGFLRSLGATEVIDRQGLQAGGERPLLKEQWAGAVDTVGGDILFNAVKGLRRGGSLACCGLTAGTEFQGNVLPFILRGVNLLGVDSVEIPLVVKASMWDKLSVQWKIDLSALVREVSLGELAGEIERILQGQQVGRVLVDLG
ncbi:YhdH/YhfP family quinone oxidoreductase [Stutzerimonas urumqiensis]|uniref:YhdH/YhfP family quinone oxidoreductase n=1 Tax=Stutzerimonas urumqiensis TaxID=638269 RepID=UPI003BAC3525